MQIFLLDRSIIQTAEWLDTRRFHKQIVETKQIIKAIKGESEAWKNHPICFQYKNYLEFLNGYLYILEKYFELHQEYKHKVGFSRLIENILKAKSKNDKVFEEYWKKVDISPTEFIYTNFAANFWEDNEKVKKLIPSFITQEYIDNFKARLYIKDPVYYYEFKPYFDKGLGRNNMYFVDGEWKLYPQNDWKKLIKD